MCREISYLNERDSTETRDLLSRLGGGDQSALERLMEMHRIYLRKLVDVRMEPGLRRRVDPSDVVQETYIVVSQRIEKYLKNPPASFRVWLRSTAVEKLIDLRRRHLAKKRSIGREIHLSDASSMALARGLFGGRPSQILQRKELAEQVRQIIMQLGDTDREILLLRHVEELSNSEAAEVLFIEPDTARKRLGRAMIRLTTLLSDSDVRLDN